MKVDFEVLTDVRKGEMFAICFNDTLVHLESQGKKKQATSNNSGGMRVISKSDEQVISGPGPLSLWKGAMKSGVK